MINPELSDETRYIDLVKFMEKWSSNCYTDFEGMADPKGILERAEWAVENTLSKNTIERLPDHPELPEKRRVLKTLLIHYLYMAKDSADYEPDDTNLMEITTVIEMVIGCRYFLREDAK